jgi:hypothetical protein
MRKLNADGTGLGMSSTPDWSPSNKSSGLRFYFSRTGVTLTAVSDWPHSKQNAFNRDVISPQDGHILCDPNPAICGFSLRIL